MGKRIISRARGAGGPRYRAPSHRYKGKPSYSFTVSAKIVDILHDPARDSPLARILTKEGIEKFIIPAAGARVGDEIYIKEGPTNSGNILPLSSIPKGSFVFAIENYPGSGPKLCKSAGTKAIVTGQETDKVILQMPSQQFKEFNPNCLATIGVPAGGGRGDKLFVKAGQNFYLARARNKLWPRSSAVKMNPVDHPFGGHTKPGTPKTTPRGASPGAKVGSFGARRSGLRKK